MRLHNTDDRYGFIAIALHWLAALLVCGLFGLGLWMTSLTYYDAWYKKGPALHKAIGILLFALMTLRLAWRWMTPAPAPHRHHTPWEQRAAAVAHGLLYLLTFSVMVSGYLISTADGRSIEVFGWLEIPATITSIPDQEDVAGAVHLALAITLLSLAALHSGAALKHHFFDKDRTLLRMLGR